MVQTQICHLALTGEQTVGQHAAFIVSDASLGIHLNQAVGSSKLQSIVTAIRSIVITCDMYFPNRTQKVRKVSRNLNLFYDLLCAGADLRPERFTIPTCED
jgi:hypothetical protein